MKYRKPINALDLALQPLERIEWECGTYNSERYWRPTADRLKSSDEVVVRDWIKWWAETGQINRFRIMVGDDEDESQ